MSDPPLLRLAGLVARRGAAGAGGFTLRVPTLELRRGDTLVLLGPSGVGKSTLLELLALASAPQRAETFAFQPAETALDVMRAWGRGARGLDAWRARHVGYLPQSGGLLPFLTVRQNIVLQAELAGQGGHGAAAALGRRLGIAAVMDRYPETLSGGERQRAALARALIHAPALIVADEPTAAVDPAMAEQVFGLLLAEAAGARATLVMASHDHANVHRLGLPVMNFVAEAGGAMAARAA